MAKESQIWNFTYHRGPAPLQGYCRASSEAIALQVATRWCEDNRCRPPAAVRPWILADESILEPKVEEVPVSA